VSTHDAHDANGRGLVGGGRRRLVHAGHLVRRLATSLSLRPPDAAEVVWGEAFLLPAELQLWRRLDNIDRRHSLQVTRRFHLLRPDASRAELAAAMLHDIGKLDSGLGTLGRVVASVLGPRTERLRRYHDHEAIGAAWLAAGGSDPLTVQLVAGTSAVRGDLRKGAAAAALQAADNI
jgi:hypothetical protein